jgi:hypothetical protein
LLEFIAMDGQKILTILKVIIAVSRVILFCCTAFFVGAIPFIWAEAFFGIGWGIVAGLVVGGGAGLLANAVLSKILYWLMPDLRALLRHN